MRPGRSRTVAAGERLGRPLRAVGHSLRAAGRRLRTHGPALLLAAAAAGTAYLLAGVLFTPQDAVFAPIAAVVATGLSAGQRIRRASEISLGVVLGLTAADLLSRWLGIGPVQLSLAVLLAMGAAVLVRPSGLLANQAAVAAVVVVALVPYLDAGPWVRLGDALVGGAVAVVFNALFSPDPYRAVRSATDGLLTGYAAALRQVAAAVREDSLSQAEAALAEMDQLEGARAEIADALAATRERLVLRRGTRAERREAVRGAELVGERVAALVATGRSVARAAANLVRHAGGTLEVASALADSLDQLADAVAELAPWSEDRVSRGRGFALAAATTASDLLPGRQTVAGLVAQVRSGAVDVLRVTGLPQTEAVTALEDAAGRADQLGLEGGRPGTAG